MAKEVVWESFLGHQEIFFLIHLRKHAELGVHANQGAEGLLLV